MTMHKPKHPELTVDALVGWLRKQDQKKNTSGPTQRSA